MTNQSKAIICIILGGIVGLWAATKVPFLLQEIPKLPDPESTGHVTGISLQLLAATICVIYGIVLYRRYYKQAKSNKGDPGNHP